MKTLFLLAKNVELFGLKKLNESVAIFAPLSIFKKYKGFLVGEVDLDQSDIFKCHRILFHASFVPKAMSGVVKLPDVSENRLRWEVKTSVEYGGTLTFDARTTADQFCQVLESFQIPLFDVQPLFRED